MARGRSWTRTLIWLIWARPGETTGAIRSPPWVDVPTSISPGPREPAASPRPGSGGSRVHLWAGSECAPSGGGGASRLLREARRGRVGGSVVEAQVDLAFLGADDEQRASVTGAPADSPVLLVGGLDGARQVPPEQRSQPAGKPGGLRIAAGEEDLEGGLTAHGPLPDRSGSGWHPSETASRRKREKGERRARRLPGIPRGGKGSFGTP